MLGSASGSWPIVASRKSITGEKVGFVIGETSSPRVSASLFCQYWQSSRSGTRMCGLFSSLGMILAWRL